MLLLVSLQINLLLYFMLDLVCDALANGLLLLLLRNLPFGKFTFVAILLSNLVCVGGSRWVLGGG